MSKRANGRSIGPVLTSLLLFVPDHSVMVPGCALIALSTGRRRKKTHLHLRRVYICIYISLDAGISFLHYEKVEEVKEVKEVAQEEAGEDDAWGRKRMTNLRAQGELLIFMRETGEKKSALWSKIDKKQRQKTK